MKTLSLALIMALTLSAQAPDLKRNQELQKLTHAANVAVRAKQAFIDAWVKECTSKGKQLISVDINEVDCVVLPPASTMPPTPAKTPEAAK